MIVRVDIEDPRWYEFVLAHPDATPFHHPAWAALLADCYRHRAFALAVVDSAGRIVAGLPVLDVSTRLTGRRWVALPYTDVCSPLVGAGGRVGDLVAGLDEERERRQIRTLECRAELPAGYAQLRGESVTHTLELQPDLEQVQSAFKPSVRRNIAKGQRSGVIVRRTESVEEIDHAFYALQLETRRRQGVPVQPRRYFGLLWERIVAPGLGFCLLAKRNGKPIAGAVFLAWKGTLVYKYGASDPRNVDYRPNNLLIWEAIRWGCANGYTLLDFGRSDLDNLGLRRFKGSWGAREWPLRYSVLGEVGRAAAASERASLLAPLIRRSPPLVCRALGELLYRYAA